MRKLALLCLALFTVTSLGVATALPGPDPVTGPFSVSITNADPGSDFNGQLMDRLEFARSFPGWDFGDREGYRCAYVERFGTGNALLYTVTFELFRSAAWAKINDKNGPDSNNNTNTGPTDYCGVTGPATTYDGEDHFPHLIHPGDGLTFSDGGFIPLNQGACDRAYWTNGDSPGEVILWWDEDGPTGSHSEGVDDLACGGGPGEPVPVLRGNVQMKAAGAAAGITYCSHSAHEDLCSGVEPSPTPTLSPSPTIEPSPSPSPTPPPVTLVTLGAGTSELVCPDASVPEVTQADPLRVAC